MKPEDIRYACAKTLGWRQQERFESSFRDPQLTVSRGHQWMHPNGYWCPPPNYPDNPDAALALCDKLASEGWLCKITMEGPQNWTCLFYKSRPTKTRACYGKSATLSGAICEAFLRVKGLWVETDSAN